MDWGPHVRCPEIRFCGPDHCLGFLGPDVPITGRARQATIQQDKSTLWPRCDGHLAQGKIVKHHNKNFKLDLIFH